jgi:hypothetical protein
MPPKPAPKPARCTEVGEVTTPLLDPVGQHDPPKGSETNEAEPLTSPSLLVTARRNGEVIGHVYTTVGDDRHPSVVRWTGWCRTVRKLRRADECPRELVIRWLTSVTDPTVELEVTPLPPPRKQPIAKANPDMYPRTPQTSRNLVVWSLGRRVMYESEVAARDLARGEQ